MTSRGEGGRFAELEHEYSACPPDLVRGLLGSAMSWLQGCARGRLLARGEERDTHMPLAPTRAAAH